MTRARYLKLLICLLLALTTLGVYSEVRNFDFVTFDDYTYVAGNPNVQSGLSKKGLAWALTGFYAANWHPVTWLSHMLDCQLFGLNPGMHHLNNLIFHTANTLLLFLVLGRMTGALWRSAFVSALFALHPLHVESVAWVAERKDVLSTLFWMLTMWAYVRYSERPSLTRYLLIFPFFILGLMSKPMLVTLPFVLLLMDYWPLGRLQSTLPEKSGKLKTPKPVILRLIAEKIPLFVFVALLSVVTFLAQGEAVQSLDNFHLKARIANSLVSYTVYIRKMFWPNDLSIFYPYPQTLQLWLATASGFFLITMTILFVKMGKRRPFILVGWLWYLGTLFPVIGLVQVGTHAMADRYTYIPLIGLFIMIVWGVPDLLGNWPYRKLVLRISAGLLLVLLAVCTWFQVSYWKDSIALFTHAIDVTDDNWMAHNNIGFPLVQQGRNSEAIAHFSEAVRIKPDHAEAHVNLANSYGLEGRFEEAKQHFFNAIRINPDLADAHMNLGVIFARQGNLDKAINHFLAALRVNPDDVTTRLYLNRALQLRRGSGKPPNR
ncbi:MAG: tetratricopeptide repeat protein [Deltaproteobacteria bacterium]|nr:tetratricopeptide repeat protein [Deltaproteobacteria bacterium]